MDCIVLLCFVVFQALFKKKDQGKIQETKDEKVLNVFYTNKQKRKHNQNINEGSKSGSESLLLVRPLKHLSPSSPL